MRCHQHTEMAYGAVQRGDRARGKSKVYWLMVKASLSNVMIKKYGMAKDNHIGRNGACAH